MKFLTLLGLVATATALTQQQSCAQKCPHCVTAIGEFCQASKLMVPSTYAKNGKSAGSGSSKAFVNIQGSCKPAQYVPPADCLNQFWEVCADGNSKGAGSKNFGWYSNSLYPGAGTCQKWQITHGGLV